MVKWPQYLTISYYALVIIVAFYFDGQPKLGKYNASSMILGTVISAWVLWCGGFWDSIS